MRRLPSILVFFLLVGCSIGTVTEADTDFVSENETPLTPSPTNAIGMEFILIPAGSFLMGSENGELDEQPVHEVTLRRSFYIGKYEVSQEEYTAITRRNPSQNTYTSRLPVKSVTWLDAVRFANALSLSDGLPPCYDYNGYVIGAAKNDVFGCEGHRLPTEAEWEYAARAGTTTEYSWGNDPSRATEYASLPNPWGLFDVHGSVMEWCHDRYHPNYYLDSPAANPFGPETGQHRVFRGEDKGWEPPRSAERARNVFGYYNGKLGFRLVRTAQ